MSWDIFVQDLPADVQTVADIPDDFRPAPLGIKRADLIAQIKAVVPAADFTNPVWGLIRADGFSIEVSIGKPEEVRSFAFHVRGSSDEAVGIIADILDHLKLRALDGENATGFFDREASIASLHQWRIYRDHVVGKNNN